MESGSHFQKTEQQIREYAAAFPEMSDTGIQDREHQNITTQSGDRFKTVHNRGIQHGSGRVGGGCLFFCAGYFRQSISPEIPQTHNSHREPSGSQQDSKDSESRELPLHTGMYQIGIDKYRTGMVGKGEEILRFPVADLLSGIEIGSDFCTHRITAEKSEKKSTGAGRGDAEYFF